MLEPFQIACRCRPAGQNVYRSAKKSSDYRYLRTLLRTAGQAHSCFGQGLVLRGQKSRVLVPVAPERRGDVGCLRLFCFLSEGWPASLALPDSQHDINLNCTDTRDCHPSRRRAQATPTRPGWAAGAGLAVGCGRPRFRPQSSAFLEGFENAPSKVRFWTVPQKHLPAAKTKCVLDSLPKTHSSCDREGGDMQCVLEARAKRILVAAWGRGQCVCEASQNALFSVARRQGRILNSPPPLAASNIR